MSPPTQPNSTKVGNGMPRPVRSVFISDCHLGSPHARPDLLLAFLNAYAPERAYLVGDIFDGWALRKRWRWDPTYTRIIHRLIEWARSGVEIHYTPGNHDEFLREYLQDFGFVQFASEFRYRGPDGRDYLVTHGDDIDDTLSMPAWLHWAGSLGYDAVVWANGALNRLRGLVGLSRTRFGLRLRDSIGAANRFLERWEEAIIARAKAEGFTGVICGHVHTPKIRHVDGFRYVNIGDWMENCVALVEDHHGTLMHVGIDAEESQSPRRLDVAPASPRSLTRADEALREIRSIG